MKACDVLHVETLNDGSFLVRIPAGGSPVDIRWGKSFIRLNTDEPRNPVLPARKAKVARSSDADKEDSEVLADYLLKNFGYGWANARNARKNGLQRLRMDNRFESALKALVASGAAEVVHHGRQRLVRLCSKES